MATEIKGGDAGFSLHRTNCTVYSAVGEGVHRSLSPSTPSNVNLLHIQT
jgi:hypothetical protein